MAAETRTCDICGEVMASSDCPTALERSMGTWRRKWVCPLTPAHARIAELQAENTRLWSSVHAHLQKQPMDHALFEARAERDSYKAEVEALRARIAEVETDLRKALQRLPVEFVIKAGDPATEILTSGLSAMQEERDRALSDLAALRAEKEAVCVWARARFGYATGCHPNWSHHKEIAEFCPDCGHHVSVEVKE